MNSGTFLRIVFYSSIEYPIEEKEESEIQVVKKRQNTCTEETFWRPPVTAYIYQFTRYTLDVIL
jgi:hypothetical protein